jgi:hypothetical protein
MKNIGTLNGKIKAVIVDAGFCCYKVYEMSTSYRIIPIVRCQSTLTGLTPAIPAFLIKSC